MPSFNLGSYLGQPVVGILGLDLLKKLVLHIDYVHQTVELIDPKTFTPPDSPDAALPVISFAGNIWTQAAAINDQVQAIGIFMIDTGDGGAVTLTKLMQEQNPGFRLHASRPSGAVGLGGEATSHGGWSSGLGLGPVVLPNPWMDLEDTKTGGTATICGGQIGNLIWNRFDFTLDLPDGTLYLKKNKTFGEPIRVPHGGMLVQAQGSDYSILTIADIYPGSASAKAGFQVGDVLLSIDELKDQPLTIERLSSAIREPGTWHVKIRRKGQLLSLTLKLEELPGAPASAPASPAAATAASAMAPLAK
ncbi:MAG: PDZ domain-containing protein [Verrucomicrobiota bacterium]